ncbi:hypothetical protein TeGR_g13235 [Tetraparma gracilis]|uniref:Uncharacterized protein n=1 Tax=Tetraparma gracilis TaxID=2962635 RepID=A0ABQ6MY09_9STRA|nr:hypothetical protein TeGR_g13235 [Tetraparma gracilis]
MHVFLVSLLMVAGKMFPVCCYKNEVTLKTRLALSLGMCPRGEVGAGVIVISIAFGICGQCITIAVMCLALNLIMSSGFIMAVKHLAMGEDGEEDEDGIKWGERKTSGSGSSAGSRVEAGDNIL